MIDLQKSFKSKTEAKKDIMRLVSRRMRQNNVNLIDLFEAIDTLKEYENLYWVACEDGLFFSSDKGEAEEYKQSHKDNLLFYAVLFNHHREMEYPLTQLIISMHKDLWQMYFMQSKTA